MLAHYLETNWQIPNSVSNEAQLIVAINAMNANSDPSAIITFSKSFALPTICTGNSLPSTTKPITIAGASNASAILGNVAFTLTNRGTIRVGAGQAEAIQEISATHALTLKLQAGSNIIGNVAASTYTINGNVTNAGTVASRNNAISTLTVAGNYAGQGETLLLYMALGGDNSATDCLAVTGDTSGTTEVKITK